MATNDTEVIGLTLCKINGTWHLDVENARWSVKRADSQHVTGAGIKQAIGQEMPSGSFSEVIPLQKALDWRSLRFFTIDIYDKATRSIVVASFSGCNWVGLDGSSDLAGAMTRKDISWVGSVVNQA